MSLKSNSPLDQPKVSIITPFYNASAYVLEAVESVLKQTYSNWELLLINDGSTDDSKKLVHSMSDERIRYFEQENQGVAAARNVGLSRMKGDYFCFFDADDVLPIDSLAARIAKFNSNPELAFVDGRVIVMDSVLETIQRTWSPDFNGNPLSDLISLTGKSFLGATWMVRREQGVDYFMQASLTHSEDLLFYMGLARKGGLYGFTNNVTLVYRNNPTSAMKDLKGLEHGYRSVFHTIKDWAELDRAVVNSYCNRTRRIMFRSHLRNGSIKKALHVLKNWPNPGK